MSKEDVIKLPSASVLKGLVAKAKTTASKTSTLNGAYGEAVAHATEEHNLHAQAFRLCVRLERMDAVKLMSFLSHFDDYRSKLGLDNLAAADIPGMDDDDEDDETTTPGDGAKVKMMDAPGTAAARKAEQAAGAAALEAMAPETKKAQSEVAKDKLAAAGLN